MVPQDWHETTLTQLHTLLAADPIVRGLLVYGSAAKTPDLWSDLDVCIVLADGGLPRYFPTFDWLKPLGDIWAHEQHRHKWTHTTRVCFADGRRIDSVLTTETALAHVVDWPHVPFADAAARRVIFSHSAVLDQTLLQPLTPYTPAAFTTKHLASRANDFFFKATEAVQKIVRGDMLVAAHLAQDLTRESLVLTMILRDRQGAGWNDSLLLLAATVQPLTADGLLTSIATNAHVFEALAGRLESSYKPRRDPLIAMIDAARKISSTL